MHDFPWSEFFIALTSIVTSVCGVIKYRSVNRRRENKEQADLTNKTNLQKYNMDKTLEAFRATSIGKYVDEIKACTDKLTPALEDLRFQIEENTKATTALKVQNGKFEATLKLVEAGYGLLLKKLNAHLDEHDEKTNHGRVTLK